MYIPMWRLLYKLFRSVAVYMIPLIGDSANTFVKFPTPLGRAVSFSVEKLRAGGQGSRGAGEQGRMRV
ncbi:MAG TPA: hypothetical protein DEG17_14210, partial [Cyanobacteria bacterium UBA11149]|nr:hypothetical protein [Cyanobacteria bacterium UBA11149]